jgi:citrate synthase
MSNCKSNSSIGVSFRVPTSMYMQLLEMVVESNMNITDCMRQILYKHLNGKLIELKENDIVVSLEEIESLNNQINVQSGKILLLTRQLNKTSEEKETLKNENLSLNKLLDGLRIVIKYEKMRNST